MYRVGCPWRLVQFLFGGTLFTNGTTLGGTSLAVGTTMYCVTSWWHLACKWDHGVQSRSPLVTGSISLFVAPCLQGRPHLVAHRLRWGPQVYSVNILAPCLQGDHVRWHAACGGDHIQYTMNRCEPCKLSIPHDESLANRVSKETTWAS